MAEQIAKFRFKEYKIVESQISTNPEEEASQNLNVEFEQTIGVNEEGNNMRLEMIANINDENKVLVIRVKAQGFFEFDSDLNTKEKEKFFRTNAPAILFPYVRAYITTLSSLSGVKPVILPTLNMSQR
ncbi:MAG: protein-export chaperone SecB [Paludibacteraceae bacterium]|nr:protein-export chaperone SecB [Paludibacteraceae bacterium]